MAPAQILGGIVFLAVLLPLDSVVHPVQRAIISSG
jgi:hypothetical protein